MQRTQWNYDQLDDIFFQKTETEEQCFRGMSPKKANKGLGPVGERIFKGDEKKFLKQLQECLNWEKPQNEIAETYTNMMKIGYQPDVVNLNKLKKHDDHIDWKLQQDEIKKQKRINLQKQIDLEYAINKKHQLMKLEEQKQRMQAKQVVAQRYKGSRNESPSYKHIRTVTFDLATPSTPASKMEKFSMSLNQCLLAEDTTKFDQEKSNDSVFRMSESTANSSITNISNYRQLHTPSPTKLRREKNMSFAFAANAVMNSQINFNDVEVISDGYPTIGTSSPNVRERGMNLMPGQSLFDFSNKNSTSRIISSQRNSRPPTSPMKKGQQSYGSSQQLQQKRQTIQEYNAVTN